MRRMMLAMSQGNLGDALGLTFQQVQKYEKGTNRIGASRLQQISHILQVPVAFFFEGAPDASVPRRSHGSALSTAQIDDFVSDSELFGNDAHTGPPRSRQVRALAFGISAPDPSHAVTAGREM
jgi:transcriptional regulator with XRE-family HTH domain